MDTMTPISFSSNDRENAPPSGNPGQHESLTPNDRQTGNWLSELVGDSPTDPGFLPPDGYELAIVGRAFIVRAAQPVHKKLAALVKSGVIADDALTKIFCKLVSLLWQAVFGVVSSSVVVELAAAKSTGLLQGDSKTERYRFFIECLVDSDFTNSFLHSSPVIVAQLEVICKNWEITNLELLTHVSRDHEIVRNHFFPNQPSASIVAINRSQGDTHRQGRSVAIIDYDCDFKLVYKPRSLAADLAFSNFANWFNTIAGEELLSTVSALDCGDHGWCEFIEHRPLSNKSELDAYYFRLGVLLAISRTLGLSDLHSENLIAAGDWPVIIDLETLFHPLTSTLVSSHATSCATDRLCNILDRSVFASGLLPTQPNDLKSNADWLDMSGTSDIAGRQTPFELPYWQNTGTDEMCLSYGRRTLDGDQNVPVMDSKRVPPKLFVAQIISGFRKAYDLLISERDWLVSEQGPMMAFSDCAVRCVFRPTQYYEALLFDGSHAIIMQDLKHKSNWLKKTLNNNHRNSLVGELVEPEQAALWQNDIPYFETTPGSTNVRSCDGQLKQALLTNSGLDIARQTIKEMGRDDLARQCWLIRSALAKVEAVGKPALAKLHINHNADFPLSTITECAPKIAHRAAQYLCDTAVVDGGYASWLTLRESAIGTLTCGPAGLDLYSGLPGIALFLSHAGVVFENSEYTRLGRAAVNEVLRLIDDDQKEPPSVGAYSGVCGLAFALFEMQRHFPDLQLVQVCLEQVHSIDLETLEIPSLDMIDGVAGLISCLCALCENGSKTGVSEKEHRYLIRLVHRSCQVVAGRLITLERSHDVDPILSHTGMAHGILGLKSALVRAQCLGVPKISDVANKVLDRLSQFKTEKSTTNSDGEITHNIAWCNGLTGVILSEILTKGTADRRLITVLKDTLMQGQYLDDSLCHGSMGAVATLSYLKSTCPAALAKNIDHSIANIVGRIHAKGIRCGTIGSIQSPGLMDGMSGVGMAALSLLQPAATPMILVQQSTSFFQPHSRPENL